MFNESLLRCHRKNVSFKYIKEAYAHKYRIKTTNKFSTRLTKYLVQEHLNNIKIVTNTGQTTIRLIIINQNVAHVMHVTELTRMWPINKKKLICFINDVH